MPLGSTFLTLTIFRSGDNSGLMPVFRSRRGRERLSCSIERTRLERYREWDGKKADLLHPGRPRAASAGNTSFFSPLCPQLAFL